MSLWSLFTTVIACCLMTWIVCTTIRQCLDVLQNKAELDELEARRLRCFILEQALLVMAESYFNDCPSIKKLAIDPQALVSRYILIASGNPSPATSKERET